jgi:3D (Asp-Asp-Asp) domain-containing protein
VVRSDPVSRLSARTGGRAAALTAVLTVSLLAAASGVGSPGGGRAKRLRHDAGAVAERARGATLELYAVESELSRADARLRRLGAEMAQVRRRHEALRRELTATQHSLRTYRGLVAARLRTLYVQGDVDPLTVILGASSLDDALAKIDALDRLTRQSEAVVERAALARRRLRTLSGRLAARSAQLAALARDTERAAAALAASRARHVSLIASLRVRERLDRQAVARLDAAARAASAKAARLAAVRASSTPPPAASAAAAPTAASGAGALTVLATGYSMRGRTATGVPAGWGVAAVDPSLIPLGTRFDVPGYGEAIAADVGSLIQGASVDLWFPTRAQARAWGRRTITITIR